MKPLRRTLALLIFISISAAARADSFTFNFAGGGQSAAGSLTANATGTAGQFLIQSISGTLTGVMISALLPTGSFLGNDNVLNFSGTTYIPDGAGFSFALTNGVQVNVFTSTMIPGLSGQFLRRSDGTIAQMATFSITPVPVPEPSTWLLLGTGSLGLLQAARRRILCIA